MNYQFFFVRQLYFYVCPITMENLNTKKIYLLRFNSDLESIFRFQMLQIFTTSYNQLSHNVRCYGVKFNN